MKDDILNNFRNRLDTAIDSVKKARDEDDRRRLMSTIGQDLAGMMAPFLAEIAQSSKLNKESLAELMYQLRGEVADASIKGIDTTPIITAIEQAMGNVNIPQPKVTVKIPPIRMPDIKMPDEMSIKGWAEMMGAMHDTDNPIPVQLRDHKGNPINLFENLTSVMSGGGGKADFFTIKGFSQSAYAELMNSDGRLRVSVETGGSGLTDSELRATAVPVSQLSGANWSVSVIDIFGSVATNLINPDNRLKVELPTGTTGLTDSELRASSVPVAQASGASWSTEASQSGIWNIATVTTVTGVTNSIAASIVDSSGVQYSGSNPVPVSDAGGSITIDGTVSVSGSVSSTGAYLLNGDGTYRDTMPISGSVSVSGSVASTVVTGTTISDAVDDGSAPVKIGGIARTANPTAVAGGDTVSSSYDKLGRQLVRTQARDLTVTAYATLTTGTETTLVSGVAGSYLDLVYIMGANNSDVAVTVNIRPVTAGNIVMTLQVPANGVAGIACPMPLPQGDTGNNWTVDMGDITGTSVYMTALFSKEI